MNNFESERPDNLMRTSKKLMADNEDDDDIGSEERKFDDDVLRLHHIQIKDKAKNSSEVVRDKIEKSLFTKLA